MPGEKLLSIVLVGRNDNYGGNFKKRLQIAVNYFARNADLVGYLDRCEIVFTDWASNIPMATDITLSPTAAQITRFLYVSQEQANKFKNSNSANNFNSAVGINTALRRAKGEFHVMMPADILITQWSLKNLLDILSGITPVPFTPPENVLLIKRYFIPCQYREEDKTFAELDSYLASATQFMASSPLHPGLGMDSGMICHHRNITYSVGGYDEYMGGWGKSDTNFCLRAGVKYPLLNLSGYGVHCYDFTPTSKTLNHKSKKKNKSKDIIINNNNESWGLNNEDLCEQHCEMLEAYEAKQSCRRVDREIISDLLSKSLLKETANSLSFNNLIIEPAYYFICWHIRNFNSDTFVEFLPSDFKPSYKLRMPECAADPCGAASVVSTLNPSAMICSIFTESNKSKNIHDHKILAKQYLNKHGGRLNFIYTLLLELFPPYTHFHKWMHGFAHQFHKGIVRLITGNEADTVSRLGKHLLPCRKIDICLINQESLKYPDLITKQIWPLLKVNSVVIYQSKTYSKSQEYMKTVCSDLENCQATILTDTVILFKDAPRELWDILKNHQAELTRRLKRRLRPLAYLKSYAFDIIRSINQSIQT